MSNDKYDQETGEILSDNSETIDADRGSPIIASHGSAKVIGMAAFLIFGVVAVGSVIYSEMAKNEPRPVTQSEEITFRAPKTRGEPYIASTPIKTPPQAELKAAPDNSEYDRLLLQQRLALQAEAMRIAEENRIAMEKRIKSPQLVYDKSSFPPNTQSGSGTMQATPINGNATLFSGAGGGNESDPNLKFANEQSNIGVVTASASQLLNLSTLIAQGEMISGVLETAISSDLPGMVRAIVSENVYSFEGSNLLIPKGTRLVGQYRSSVRQGQSRVFIIWNRLIRPDGASINIGSFGTDSLGRSGLSGDVDTHFMQRFGSSILLSMIDGVLNAATQSVSNSNGSNVSLNGGNDFSRSSEIALENSINIQPTIHINQGARIKIFLGKDLDFSNVGKINIVND